MKDLTKIKGKKSIDNVQAANKNEVDAGQEQLAMDPHYMQKIIGNRAVQFLVESQLFLGAQHRAAKQDLELPDVNYDAEEARIGEDRQALLFDIRQRMIAKRGHMHQLLKDSPGQQIYVNVITDLSFAIVESNIDSEVYYDEMILKDVDFSLEDKEFTNEARKEEDGFMLVKQGFSFEFDPVEFPDLMPEDFGMEEMAAAGVAVKGLDGADAEEDENNAQNANSEKDAKGTKDAKASGNKKGEPGIIEQVIEEGKRKLL